MMRISSIFLGMLLFLNIQTTKAQAPNLDLLVEWMEGSFTTYNQNNPDTTILTHVLHIRKLQTDADSVWMYVERTLSAHPRSPYRQKVYKFWANQDGFSRQVLDIKSPFLASGAWRHRYPLRSISLDSLQAKENCIVNFEWQKGNYFLGKSGNQLCNSELNGATYFTTDFKVYPERLEILDKGFTLAGDQVWGAKETPFVFYKILDSED